MSAPTYSNPIWFGDWRIYLETDSPPAGWGENFTYAFVHDDYDGAEDANDGRHGHAATIEEAKAEIREGWPDYAPSEEWPAEHGQFGVGA